MRPQVAVQVRARIEYLYSFLCILHKKKKKAIKIQGQFYTSVYYGQRNNLKDFI